MQHSLLIDMLLDWIAPHLDQLPGDFLGYSLAVSTRDRGCHPEPTRERPKLIFMPDRLLVPPNGPCPTH
jgi:hypothetical protein